MSSRKGRIHQSPTGRHTQMQEVRFQQTTAPRRMATNAGAQATEAGDKIKDELVHSIPVVSLKELMDLALNLEYRLRERRLEKRRSVFQFQSVAMRSSARRPEENQSEKPASSEEEPMQIDVARGPLSEVERENRRCKGLCLYCGSAGHLIRMCPICPTRPSGNGNSHPL
ncbi:hypothetical protein NDU88_002281 [Pleurodeles waltl]|uniref:CCHC-type domain-containing protein n=1 Tax=Pleurodeles waltl TaxID=8319 RepID=A0AAV7PAD8_PLEWA|nr:hypothetical protein NDU88_002281 [Pleurodeles waltl]